MSLRRIAALAAAVCLAAASAAALAQRPQYTLLNPPQPTDSGKIEVIEFFWYACPHCYHLEPSVAAWQKAAPKDVVFKRVPATTANWATLASVYYTLEAMGILDQYHAKIFDAIHKQNINLSKSDLRDEWLAKQGIDVAKYREVEKSFSVTTKMQRAKQMTASYKIDSVPQLIVDGKYVVSSESAGGQERMFQAVDQAVAAARKEKTAGATSTSELVKR